MSTQNGVYATPSQPYDPYYTTPSQTYDPYYTTPSHPYAPYYTATTTHPYDPYYTTTSHPYHPPYYYTTTTPPYTTAPYPYPHNPAYYAAAVAAVLPPSIPLTIGNHIVYYTPYGPVLIIFHPPPACYEPYDDPLTRPRPFPSEQSEPGSPVKGPGREQQPLVVGTSANADAGGDEDADGEGGTKRRKEIVDFWDGKGKPEIDEDGWFFNGRLGMRTPAPGWDRVVDGSWGGLGRQGQREGRPEGEKEGRPEGVQQGHQKQEQQQEQPPAEYKRPRRGCRAGKKKNKKKQREAERAARERVNGTETGTGTGTETTTTSAEGESSSGGCNSGAEESNEDWLTFWI
ncbi:hypothetical protein BU24DRAFT_460812 [Aaosphaeria arxii CBS 175.79]|uniref:Uncharacterized protein n=1 Tax=Aaosphaeria arxii CBS 175.79 TaxID=1450172 RepID=A0A6A5XWW0_9PLEO|nr:uncharacterized protein BU24DRAFT_460812 [Aaosphaeria arxii CBS 175.79]KAF2017818.1 hypothetical protein BU24DRAFT_460812 [Aaosphaeria arxii CBS 175.79]